MKKIVSVFMAVVFCAISATLITSASENSTVMIVTDDTEYTIEFNNTTLSDEQRQSIAHSLVFGKQQAQTYGLVCTLLGHKTETTTVSVVTHKVRTAPPRCKRETYSVTTCTRCDYQEQALMSTSYILCCPED